MTEKYLETIVSPLLSKPESLQIVKTSDDMGVLLTVTVGKEDMGCLIGKSGQNILAIRKLVTVYGMRNNAKISVKVNEPIGGKFNQI